MKKSQDALAFQRQHFDHTTCKVNRGSAQIRKALGFSLSDDQLVGLSGAPTGSTIDTTEKHTWTPAEIPDGEQVPPGLLLTITNPKYLSQPNEVVIFVDGHTANRSVYIKLTMFLDDPSRKGIGGHMISVIVDAAQHLRGARRLRLQAYGGRLCSDMSPGVRWGGYAAWPKYGFDSGLPTPTKAIAAHFPFFPAGLPSFVRVSDLIDAPGGRDFWHTAGDGDYMDFDLSPNSDSLKRLEQYLEKWRA